MSEELKDSTTPDDGEVSSPTKIPSESTSSRLGDDTSTKATDENDSDSTMDTRESSDEKPGNENDDKNEEEGDAATEDNRTQEEKDEEAKEKEKAEKGRIEELKKKYKDWPLRGIKEPHDNDVMYGRGGGTNHHPGNKLYRKMVEDRKVQYVNSKRLDKPLVALEIIREWRAQLPPGRFLKMNDKTGNWDDVGDKKAREKTSQALREKAPQIRKQQEEEKDPDDDGSEEDKVTRFAEGTKDNKKGKLKKAILARDHSLGREYLAPEENVDLEGFTWFKTEEGSKKGGNNREASIGSIGSFSGSNQGQGTVLPPGRESSMGSIGLPFGQPPPPDYYGRVYSGEPRREFSNGSIVSWGAPPFYPGGPPPPPPAAPTHQRSGSWTHPHQPPSPHHGHQRSGSWNGGMFHRLHSLDYNPLPGANISRPAPTGAFEPRAQGLWGGEHAFPPGPPHGPHHPPQLPPPGAYGGFGYQSGSSMGTIGSVPGGYRVAASPSHSNTPSPPYNVNNIARTWSGGGPPQPRDIAQPPFDAQPGPFAGSPSRGHESQYAEGNIPRPGMVKRDTSNQNETFESKPNRIKRAALNRDQSATSNRLKQEYIPEVFNRDMQSLQETTEQIRLSSPVPTRPEPLAPGDRMTTIEAIAESFLASGPDQMPPRPEPLAEGGRMNTIDALGFSDLAADTSPRNEQNPSRPSTLTTDDRLTTTEVFAIANATLDEETANDDDDESPLPM